MKFFAIFIVCVCTNVHLSAQGLDNFIDPETDLTISPILTLDASYHLEFTDEFNDNTIDPNKWKVNVSQNSRAARPKLKIDDWWWVDENAYEENGNLVLRVSKPDENTMHCGSINSQNKYERTYGYYETRIQIAEADKGTHTAFWFHGENMKNVDGTGRDGAEIDVFESAWLGDYTKSVIHIDGYGADHKANTRQYSTPGIHEGYHTYGLHWTKDFLKIYYDGVLKVTYTGIWVPQQDEYIWLSDGASFGYEGDNFISQPFGVLTHAYVDYIRVWRQDDVPPEPVEFGYEAECGESKKIDWYYGESETDVSNSYFIEVNPSVLESQQEVPSSNGLINYNIVAPVAQKYDLWGRIQSPNIEASAIYIKSNQTGYYLSEPLLSQPNMWEWVLLTKEVYLNAGDNNLIVGFKDPGVKIDKYWFSNVETTLSGFAGDAVATCTVDPSKNGEVGNPELIAFEAETLRVEGASVIETCQNASNGALVNLKTSGGIFLDDFDVPAADKYNLSISYISANNRPADLYVNEVLISTLNYARSGPWCFNGGTPQTLSLPITLNQAGNSFSIVPTGELGPHIDKFTLEPFSESQEVSVNLEVAPLSMTEGESLAVTIQTSDSVWYDQEVNLSLVGLNSDQYQFDTTTLIIPQGESTATTFLEVFDDQEAQGDREITINLELSSSSVLSLGAQTSLSLFVVDNDVVAGLMGGLDGDITLSPVPSGRYLTISSKQEILEVQVHDMLGRKRQIGEIEGNTLDISALKSGVYLIQLVAKRKTYISRFIKE